MGDPLSRAMVDGFFDELEKQAAGERVVLHGLRDLAQRIGNPIRTGFPRGWSRLSPTKLIGSGTEGGQQLGRAVARTQAAEKALATKGTVVAEHGGEAMKGLFGRPIQYNGQSMPGRARAYLATRLRAGTHLAPGAELSKGVKGLAERASRAGWTGEGAMTKYLPIGQKGFLATGAAATAHDVHRQVRDGRQPGESGIGENVGGLVGYTAPAVLLGGMPTASLVGALGGMFAGGNLGRRLDNALAPQNRPQQAMGMKNRV